MDESSSSLAAGEDQIKCMRKALTHSLLLFCCCYVENKSIH